MNAFMAMKSTASQKDEGWLQVTELYLSFWILLDSGNKLVFEFLI
jgi:hypothetical protein